MFDSANHCFPDSGPRGVMQHTPRPGGQPNLGHPVLVPKQDWESFYRSRKDEYLSESCPVGS